jgi:hypothetical protein
VKASVSISRDLAALPPRRRLWRWYVALTGPYQGGHIYASDYVGSISRLGAVADFCLHGLPWLIRAWRL